MDFSAESFFQQSRDPLFALSLSTPEVPFVAANTAFARLVGREAADLFGTSFTSLLTEASVASFQVATAMALGSHSPTFHVTLKGRSGAELMLEVSGTLSSSAGCLYCVARRLFWQYETSAGLPRDVIFKNIVHGLVDSLGVTQAYLTRAIGWPVTQAEVLAGITNGEQVKPFHYDLAGTPCAEVMGGAVRTFDSDLQAAFPKDHFLEETNAECYVGMPVRDEGGVILGHICVLDDKPMSQGSAAERLAAVRTAGRAASRELARMRAEALLRTGEGGDLTSLQGTALFHALTRQIAEALQVTVVFAAEFEDQVHGRFLSLWDGKNHSSGARYLIANTPCGLVLRGEVCQIADGTHKTFEGNAFLESMKIESAVVVPIVDSSGRTIGTLGALDTRPSEAVEERAYALRLFAGRIASEIERMRSAKVAEESEARFRRLVEHAADMLFVHDRAGNIRDCNRAAARELLELPEVIVGKNMADIRVGVSAEDVAREGARLEASVPLTSEAIFRRADGTTFTAEVRAVLFEHAGEEIVISSARDITEQKRAAALLESALAALSTPMIEVWDGTLALPVIGTVDGERATRMMQTLLDSISTKQAEFAILDVTGVASVDMATANHLLDIARAASLLGSECLVSGVSPTVARALVELGSTDTAAFKTFGTLKDALRHALGRRGVRVSKK